MYTWGKEISVKLHSGAGKEDLINVYYLPAMLGQMTNGYATAGQLRSNQMCYLLSVQLGQVAESHGERLCVVLLDPEVDWLQTAHVEKQLGLLQSHGAATTQRRPHKGLGGK